MKNDLSPSFDVHRDWLEKLVDDTPTPHKSQKKPETTLLTVDGSPTEHILRGSKSWAARSFRSRTSGNSLRVPSNKENRSTNNAENSRPSTDHSTSITGPVLGEIAPNGQSLRSTGPWKLRPSPTPSLKKKKAEAIVKAHGSPQHVRVTAGGRIVPSEQSPLCHPRYGYSAVKTNGGLIKFAPNHPMGKAQWTQATQDGFVAQDMDGRLCQIVNGTILPLNEVDGALRLYVPAPNLNITSRGSSFGPSAQGCIGPNGKEQRNASQSKPAVPADPPIPAQTNALELEYSKLEHELRELDKTEVLHGRTMGKAAKEALVGKRRELVVTLDNIRKAIKSIKAAPLPDAPTPPRGVRNPHSTSPPRNRLPAFLQQRAQQSNDLAIPPMHPTYNHYFGMVQHQPTNGQYGFQTTPSPEAPHNQSFGVPSFFVPPPPFDGSMASTFPQYPEGMTKGFHGPQPLPDEGTVGPMNEANGGAQLPQNDGARSIIDLHKVGSPRQSRALDIKAPESKPAVTIKSTLNPMSPVYKPGAGVLEPTSNTDRPAPKSVKDRVPTPLSPLHQLRPSAAVNKASHGTNDTSPAKKSPHLHSSSISSFETADFFPRNTREYSTRKYAYPEQSEDKENVDPTQTGRKTERSPTTPLSDTQGSDTSKAYRAPAPPPGTPANQGVVQSKRHMPIHLTTTDNGSDQTEVVDIGAVPDRQTHNLSPKSKRQDFLFVEERPRQYSSQDSSSLEKFQTCCEDTPLVSSPTNEIDFTEASSDWIEGYRAGLARRPVGSDRLGDFVDGYCAGLLKSKPATNVGPSTGSPMKPTSRRPSPVVVQSRSSSRLQLDHREATAKRPPFESQLQSMDTLKEAVLAPQNEDAILTPTADAPHANEPPFNLGAWAKSHDPTTSTASTGTGIAGFGLPHRTSSMLKRQAIVSESKATAQQYKHNSSIDTDMLSRHTSAASELSGVQGLLSMSSSATGLQSFNPDSSYNQSNRVSSMTSIDSNLYRQWPGHRVFSPHLEWKSASSIAQAAGLASGHFANVESDGALQSMHRHPASHTDISPFPDPPTQRQTSITSNPVMQTHSRFKEGSIDGITNPPNSPQPNSPPMSPSIPAKNDPSKESKKKEFPGRGTSPAKAKFEHIAGKVGIKVSSGKKEDEASPNSPPGKRKWRDVWRGGARKEPSKDDEKPLMSS